MEYVQMTLNDWMEMKDKLRRELQGVKQSFVRIGYHLRKIDDGKYYEQDGYKSVAEFASAEYGLEPSTTSRFMSINREYSVDGYSERLRPEYIDLKRSQLEEMLKLPEADRAMITKDTPREAIRELKRFNAEESTEADMDLKGLIEEFFRNNKDSLNEFYKALETGTPSGEEVAEIICPSGSRTFKKYPYFMIMTEEKVSVKCKNADTPNIMTWEEFAGLVIDIFPAAGERTWENYFGGGEEMEEPAMEKDEPIGAAGHECLENSEETTEEAREKNTEEEQEDGADRVRMETVQSADIATENIPKPTEDEAAAAEAEQTKPEEPNTEAEFAAGPEEQTPEEKTAAEEEKPEGTAIAPAQLSAVKIEVGFAEQENLRSAYLSLATIALRLEKDYPGDIRETAEGVRIYNAAMGIKEILRWAGVEVEDLFENCGGTD